MSRRYRAMPQSTDRSELATGAVPETPDQAIIWRTFDIPHDIKIGRSQSVTAGAETESVSR